MKKGFTLIELLVVILVIGILASIAIPYYQKAVTHSRYGAVISLIRAMANAEDAYFLSNNKYTPRFSDLDLDMPPGYKITTSSAGDETLEYPNGDKFNFNTAPAISSIRTWVHGDTTVYLEYYFEYTRSTSYGRFFTQPLVCWAKNGNKQGNELCQFLAGDEPSVMEAYGNTGYNVKY